jgi:hypothetical protein
MNVVESAVGGYLLGSLLLSLLDQGSGWEFWVTAWMSCFINILRPVKGVSVMCCSTWVAKTVHKNLDKPLTCAKVHKSTLSWSLKPFSLYLRFPDTFGCEAQSALSFDIAPLKDQNQCLINIMVCTFDGLFSSINGKLLENSIWREWKVKTLIRVDRQSNVNEGLIVMLLTMVGKYTRKTKSFCETNHKNVDLMYLTCSQLHLCGWFDPWTQFHPSFYFIHTLDDLHH